MNATAHPFAGPAAERNASRVMRLLAEVVESGTLGDVKGSGRMNRAFEQAMCSRTGAAHALTFSSATTGLMAALVATGVRPGDEVVVDPLVKFGAVAALHVGATPAFADVDLASYVMDPAAVAARGTPRTRAVIATALYGLPAPLAELRALTRARGWALIEDCAQAVFAQRDGFAAGMAGDAGVFSFQSSKQLSTGDGGMLVTHDPEIRRRAQACREHGWCEGELEEPILGSNMRMTELTAAVGLCELDRWDDVRAYHARAGEILVHALADVPAVSSQRVPPGARHAYWKWAARVEDPELRRRLVHAARVRGVRLEIGAYPDGPAYRRPALRRYLTHDAHDAPTAELLCDQLITLDVNARVPLDEVERQADILRRAATT